VAVDWTVLPVVPFVEEPTLEATPTEESTPTEEAAPTEEAQPESPLMLPGELVPPEPPAVGEAGELPVFAFRNSTEGSGLLAGYAWLTPVSFGSCPPAADALAAQPAGLDGATLQQEGRALDLGSAPMLEYDVDLPQAGDYVVSVCGCAPDLTQADLLGADAGSAAASTAVHNASVYVGVNGASLANDVNGQPLAVGGFAEQAGFSWQNRWSDPAAGISGAVTFSAAEAGLHQVNLWMADDGLIVYSLRVTPLAEANVEAGAAAACGPSLP
jgi:hypothetical protein